jgi:flagellar export protein FliJ
VKPFDTLIRLAEEGLDQKRRVLAQLEGRLDQARSDRQAIEDELAREQQQAGGAGGDEVGGDVASGGVAMFAYGAYAAEVIRRRARADAVIEAVNAQAEAAREEVRLAFAELKRYQITHDKKLADLERERAAREQAEMDEIAQNLDRRKGDRL